MCEKESKRRFRSITLQKALLRQNALTLLLLGYNHGCRQKMLKCFMTFDIFLFLFDFLFYILVGLAAISTLHNIHILYIFFYFDKLLAIWPNMWYWWRYNCRYFVFGCARICRRNKKFNESNMLVVNKSLFNKKLNQHKRGNQKIHDYSFIVNNIKNAL